MELSPYSKRSAFASVVCTSTPNTNGKSCLHQQNLLFLSQLKIKFALHFQILNSLFARKTLRHFAPKPNRFPALNTLPDHLQQQLHRLIVINTPPATYDVTQTVNGVRFPILVRRPGIRNQTNLKNPINKQTQHNNSSLYFIVNIEHWFHVVFVKVLRSNWSDRRENLIFIVIRPSERLARYS